jgi:hypothetical protein
MECRLHFNLINFTPTFRSSAVPLKVDQNYLTQNMAQRHYDAVMTERYINFVVTTFRITVSEFKKLYFYVTVITFSVGVSNNSGHVPLQQGSSAQCRGIRIHSSLSGSFDSTRERSRTTVAAQLLSYRFI